MKRRYHISRIRRGRIYDYRTIATILKVHIRTVQSWRRKGMKCINDDARPYLVLGADLISFQNQRQAATKCKLLPKEFFCLKCKTSILADEATLVETVTGKRVGRNKVQVLRKARCPKCGSLVSRLSAKPKGK